MLLAEDVSVKSVFISQVVDGITAHMMQACFYRLADSAARLHAHLLVNHRHQRPIAA